LHHQNLLGRLKNFQSVFGFAILFIGLFVINEESAFPGWYALFPAFSTFFIISAGANAWLNQKLLSNKAMVWMGLISYPMYLWHWPLLVWPTITNNTGLSPLERIIFISVSILLSWLTYRFVEQKIKHSPLKTSLKLVVGMTVVGVLAISIAENYISPRHQSSALKKILAAKLDWEFPGKYLYRVPNSGLKYYIEKAAINTTVFIGDSNMEQYTPRIDYVLKNNNGKANSAIIFGNPYNRDLLTDIFEQKEDQQKAIVDKLKGLINNSTVTNIVFAARWKKYEKNLVKKAEFKNFVDFIKLFSNKKIFIILTMPTGTELDPSNMFEGSRLGSLRAKEVNNLTFNINGFRKSVKLSHIKLQELALCTGVKIIDPLDTFCIDGIVPIFDKNGNPLYKDSGHITASYARTKASFIDATLY